MTDLINHPPHYTAHPSGVECIEVTEHMNFNVGNAVKYLWRADEKGTALEDLMKAAWYVRREIRRRAKIDQPNGQGEYDPTTNLFEWYGQLTPPDEPTVGADYGIELMCTRLTCHHAYSWHTESHGGCSAPDCNCTTFVQNTNTTTTPTPSTAAPRTEINNVASTVEVAYGADQRHFGYVRGGR